MSYSRSGKWWSRLLQYTREAGNIQDGGEQIECGDEGHGTHEGRWQGADSCMVEARNFVSIRVIAILSVWLRKEKVAGWTGLLIYNTVDL
jgi:hypothetical protein